MTNKRITELTALDGDDVADNDVLAIVDVSDTTMAASGTTKKITVAELVTDSALTNKFWPNSTTALTGANLANGDKLAVVDVGSPDVAKYITADELAQGSQFSGRYAPIADRILLTAGDFNTYDPVQDWIFGYASAIRFDASSVEVASANFVLPTWWNTFDADMYWINVGAGSGDVRWQVISGEWGDGDNLDSNAATIFTGTVTAAAEKVVKVTQLVAGRSYTDKLSTMHIIRQATNAGDTLANDAAVLGIVLTRAS